MELLLDTHTLIWFITDNPKLPVRTRLHLENKQNRCLVSLASFWEIGIKYSLGRLDLKANLEKIFHIIDETEFELFPITTNHILQNSKLEFHHQDPFDRIIIAQGITDNLTIVTKDSEFKNYNVKLLWED